jgi:N-acetylglucosamine malate deacetylase 1
VRIVETPMNVLVLAPHPDDEAIGCGGTIARHSDRGDRVCVAFLTSGELGLKHLPREQAWHIREGEARRAAAVLGVSAVEFLRRPDWLLAEHLGETASLLGPLLEREAPERVYMPHAGDAHPDHQACASMLSVALRASRLASPGVFAYEVWTPLPGYDLVKDITDAMARKLRAVRCYRSQLGCFHYDRAVRGLNQYRGYLAGRCRYAEVFRMVPQDDAAPQPAGASMAGSKP